MRIYVGGLWPGVARRDLERLVQEALRGPWYKMHLPRGQLVGCRLLEMVEHKKGGSDYCAVIEVEPNRLSWEVLQHLDGAQVHGRKLRAHRWFPRKGLTDRRLSAIHDRGLEGTLAKDRRSGSDRRRALDVRPLDREMVTAVSGFQRSYGA